MKKRGLGRGLDALLGSMGAAAPAADGTGGDGAPSAVGNGRDAVDAGLHELPIAALVAGRHQPRREFDEGQLAELAESIRAQGVVQPLVVRPLPAGNDAPAGARYEIVAGERRWRAAQLAGLVHVPAVVRTMDERTAMAVALVENIQRADLNPLEESAALHRLIAECGLTHEACAAAVGKSRAAVSNLLRLADLAPEAQGLLRAGQLSFGHAKVLLGVAKPERQTQLAKQVVQRQLSVRQTEALVQAGEAEPGTDTAGGETTRPTPAAAFQPQADRIANRWGVRVAIADGGDGKGVLRIRYADAAALEKLLAVLA